jgi:hypothetical protein
VNSQIQKLLDVSAKYVGVTEYPPNSNNVVFNTHYYGHEVSGDDFPWCAAYVWDMFREAGLSALFYGGKKTAMCAELLSYAEAHGQFIAKDKLLTGDVVLFKFATNKRRSNHTGIAITDVKNGKLTVREGNTSSTSDDNGGAVMDRVRTLDNIVGGYRPKYEEDEMTYEDFKGFMEKYETEKRSQPVSSWAKGAWDKLTEAAVFDGSAPRAELTREQAAALIERLGLLK